MSGTWTTQNKILPGAYVNFNTNTPLAITPGDRGIAVILQEMSTGTTGAMYTITATENNWPTAATTADKRLATEALKNAQKVIVYNLGTTRASVALNAALVALKTVVFNTLVFPYDETSDATMKTSIVTWIKAMRSEEGIKCQGVLANQVADDESIINVAQGVMLEDGTTLTAAQVTAWVGGATAGASVSASNTSKQYVGAIDVVPRMTKTEMEAAITAGKYIFKVDSVQSVTVVSDINSLTTTSTTKGAMFKKNRVVRTIDAINNDVKEIFESNYVGKLNNNDAGRSLLRASLVDYFNTLQNMAAIQNFTTDDVIVVAGTDKDAVLVTCNVQPLDSIEKIYINVNLS